MSKMKMTPKRFIRSKLSNKMTAEDFLSSNREFLNGHSFLSPILSAYDNKGLLPTPTLQACQSALFEHIVASDLKTAQQRIDSDKNGVTNQKVIRRGRPGFKKKKVARYTVTIIVKDYDKNDNVIGEKIGSHNDGDAIFDQKDYGAAERKADRLLFRMENSLYARIENNEGQKVITNVLRRDAMARILRAKKGAIQKTASKSTKSLGFGVRAKNDSCSFSRG